MKNHTSDEYERLGEIMACFLAFRTKVQIGECYLYPHDSGLRTWIIDWRFRQFGKRVFLNSELILQNRQGPEWVGEQEAIRAKREYLVAEKAARQAARKAQTEES